MEELFGLPAHPLVVHAVVVLLPLSALATLVAALVPRLRRHWAPVALALALLATVAVLLAQSSGEELEERVKETELVEEHEEKGESVLPWAIGLTVVAAVVVAADPVVGRRRPELDGRRVTAALVLLAVVVSAGGLYTVVDVGHSGAKATWDAVSEADGD